MQGTFDDELREGEVPGPEIAAGPGPALVSGGTSRGENEEG